jgi:hypothetical protein
MEMDVRINKGSISIPIDNPFRLDLDGIMDRIDQLAASQGAKVNGLDIRGLLPLMVKGIAGCEAGCPADAQRVVSRGYGSFALQYIEGGILTATAKMVDGRALSLKLFPDF